MDLQRGGKSTNSLTRVRTRYTYIFSPLPLPLGKFFQLGRGIVERGAQVRGSLDC